MVPAASASRVIVADERDSADTVAGLLQENGCAALAVYDGRDAVAVAASWQPDGAILDLTLPGLSGYEVARELRRIRRDGIRLVAYTGWCTPSDRERAREAGFDGFLVKPAEPGLLLQALGRAAAVPVQHSLAARVAQLQRQIELGRSLLLRAESRAEARAGICDFLERAFDACRGSIADLPAGSRVRGNFEREIERLTRRVADVRAHIERGGTWH